ncbi:MAG: GNAT family N-acetyltransferase [Dehalococcoidia bacterium]|nr:GNAT family N-acetyltransferase [Dehalococcoidia bacterium]
MNRDISFRHYRQADLPVCATIAGEAFPLVVGRFVGEDMGKVMKGQIDGSRAMSNYQDLALADGKAVGLIFGRLKREPVLISMCRTLKRLILIMGRFLLGKYGNRRKLIRLVKPGLQALRVLRRNRPASEAEIVLFAVAQEYRGTGIGRALMDRFVSQARCHKATSISVPTDETASFWFYEKYGFTRWSEFHDPMESYCAGRPIKGFIYRLVLGSASGQE